MRDDNIIITGSHTKDLASDLLLSNRLLATAGSSEEKGARASNVTEYVCRSVLQPCNGRRACNVVDIFTKLNIVYFG